MLNSLVTKALNKLLTKPTQKIIITLILLFLFRIGNIIPLSGIDQDALRKSFLELENKNSIMQIINMYSGGTLLLTPFSLGIIPFINASILIDLLTALFPFLEKLQSEEGENGRKKLLFFKKILTLLFSVGQSIFLIFSLKAYFYNVDFFHLGITVLELVSGSMLIVWLSNIIDTKGIGNGTSLIIFTNIVITALNKNLLLIKSFDSLFIAQIFFLLFLFLLICISQTARINIDVVSARQLAFLENLDKTTKNERKFLSSKSKDTGLSIRLNQAGIFPIIIASNLFPFFSYLSKSIGGTIGGTIENFVYYFLIIGFNYFYTIVFWDPEKISEQLRKASVSVVNISPGQETISYLENVVRSTSIIGGIFLCTILFFYDFVKQNINGYLLNQINISSLIILVGVAFEIQKNVRANYKNSLENNP